MTTADNYPSIPINGASIKLGQFIKLASLVATGGEAKELIVAGAVTVNGAPVDKRGAALHPGDVVCIDDECVVVAAADDLADDDYFDEATADDDFDPEKWRNL
ncbi:RNA-binding S4 domain-containing protein [Corynebacterium pseudodiphtheriticum]|uniref:RNA-binding S4 domain-containing protein n=1 Tax=Corynebacterium pseudodiphtheriticum TaxID=37637 RepID=UPI00234DC73C|nr:RNA-binding S4 domain-containing protein [Corynebacterium pseudodiphtheriticum]MDC7068944.1 RNA-binding S4 domain-containing protein [Corynebacterium pseudodiphtheriticum]MDC7084971.1 RNA-binding S4 domain-containing protein [Corynebacterium pseudodiphtheriticum]MDC7086670.1 RNA-binding S4 domain-containing protein [Corynebacterium pseudodiphtheriticum]MDK4207537.1 RNA-binding S4 domain-containing protein [Corynebacterium pseudodiphtheriticum]MDK4278486.1 RNA-binding S4 domain-containing pr